ncbi:unnamed protein product, partial [Ectocarpus sp. 12 AP-2014]
GQGVCRFALPLIPPMPLLTKVAPSLQMALPSLAGDDHEKHAGVPSMTCSLLPLLKPHQALSKPAPEKNYSAYWARPSRQPSAVPSRSLPLLPLPLSSLKVLAPD